METVNKNALWLVSLVSEKGQMSFSFLSSLISKIEKYYPQLVPFWGSVLGIPFLWLSFGLFSKWLPKLITSNEDKQEKKPGIFFFYYYFIILFELFHIDSHFSIFQYVLHIFVVILVHLFQDEKSLFLW